MRAGAAASTAEGALSWCPGPKPLQTVARRRPAGLGEAAPGCLSGEGPGPLDWALLLPRPFRLRHLFPLGNCP